MQSKWIKRLKQLHEARVYDSDFNPNLVSTRLPDGQRPRGAEKLTVGMEHAAEDPKYMEKLARHLSTYPIAGPVDKQSRDPVRLVGDVQAKMKRNFEWGLDRFQKELPELAARSEKWYEGANKITKHFSSVYGHPEHVVAAVLATQSPQKDWYQNVSLGERIMHIHAEHQETPWSKEMEGITSKVFKEDNSEHQEILKEIRGKRLSELQDPVHKAAWIRTYDEAHHASHFREVTPEGDFAEHVASENGKKHTVAWQGFKTIAKAVSALESKGDMDKIDTVLGQEHKVRSFYNNISQPNAPRRGKAPEDATDITSDTWNIRAGLLHPGLPSVSTDERKAIEVSAGLGGAPRTKKIGISGTYPVYASALRSAAHERGMVPNAAQSTVWDMFRTIATPKARKENVEKLQQSLRTGEMSHEDFLKGMSREVGPMSEPTWAKANVSQKRASTFLSERTHSIPQSRIEMFKLIMEKRSAAWQRSEGKNPKGGLNEKGRKSYERENPGSDLKRPQPEGGKRRDSFCARMKGMKEKLTSKKTANDPNSRINKSLRAWNC
jgi:hypothetical protein